jgi:hypothetical protein
MNNRVGSGLDLSPARGSAPPTHHLVTRNSSMRPGIRAKVVFGLWRSIDLGARGLLAGVATVRCNDCLRPIRWWNRRVKSGDSEDRIHLQCWKSRLFFNALVADHIRAVQGRIDENFTSPRKQEDRLQELSDSPPGRMVEQPIILLQAAQEIRDEMRVDEGHYNHNTPLRASPRDVWHFLRRFAPSRSPLPRRFCMLCGAVEFSNDAFFCSKCGTSLKP